LCASALNSSQIGVPGWDIPEAAYVPGFASYGGQLYPRKTAKAGTSAARAAISSVPKDLLPAKATDRALAGGMAQPATTVAEQSH